MGATKGACVPLHSIHYNFSISNLKAGANTMTKEVCMHFMEVEILCERGGMDSYGNMGWRFLASPENGKC
ncbi:hypothetical protein DSL72_001498 [Monilinia vaccinii-corymbosi]|uniref:Uncharacterized protein n=1 Tax=Monilinia vaccinii-corymbosi TaxID=61207 RepID=A0A8A3PA54_9HELO|nr:hypothetical protein DSL72_001498 [Monilinia vaccinii-corymbosi]